MSWIAIAIGGSAIIGGVVSSRASRRATTAQTGAASAGIDEQRRQYDQVQQMLAPYRDAGQGSLTQQRDMLGLNGQLAQSGFMRNLENSPQFSSLVRQGEEGILQNASATGGLRGGNTQGALAQFRPAMLSALMNDQYARLGGMTSLGQNSAVMTGNAGMQTSNNVTGLLQQQGANQAGNALAQGRAWSNGLNGVAQAYGQWRGMGPQQGQQQMPAGFTRQDSSVYGLGAQYDGFRSDPMGGI